MGGIGDKGQVFCTGAEVGCERLAGFGKFNHQFVGEEMYGLPLEFPLPFLINFEDGPGRCAERAVIEVDNMGVQQKQVLDICGMHRRVD